MALKVKITSFSYKISGIPEDTSGNGGGFVFDCRFIENPGRLNKFKELNGMDKPVIEFLETKTTMNDFLWNVFKIIDASIENYIERDFNDLMVSFGCTGGQHRSVYAAERTRKHIEKKYKNVETDVRHFELEKQ
jgi:RNase adaptor protein for sRNA GlmZ degradation